MPDVSRPYWFISNSNLFNIDTSSAIFFERGEPKRGTVWPRYLGYNLHDHQRGSQPLITLVIFLVPLNWNFIIGVNILLQHWLSLLCIFYVFAIFRVFIFSFVIILSAHIWSNWDSFSCLLLQIFCWFCFKFRRMPKLCYLYFFTYSYHDFNHFVQGPEKMFISWKSVLVTILVGGSVLVTFKFFKRRKDLRKLYFWLQILSICHLLVLNI